MIRLKITLESNEEIFCDTFIFVEDGKKILTNCKIESKRVILTDKIVYVIPIDNGEKNNGF